jgi:AcrR family transcriptional regulator
MRGVARHAGVSEQTVYRHFVNERGLHDAVMRRLEERARIDLATLRLEDIADVAARILVQVSSHPVRQRPPLNPSLMDVQDRMRQALRNAFANGTEESTCEIHATAALVDALWSVSTFERLAVDWELNPDQAIQTTTWVISLIVQALQRGDRPVLGTIEHPALAGKGGRDH